MSLLTNPWLQVSMGLLANNGPSLSPVNPWAGIGQGLMNAQNAQYAEQENAYKKAQMEQEQAKFASEKRKQQYIDELAKTETNPQMAAMARVAPDEYIKRKMTPAPASVHISTAGELGLQGYDPKTPIEVKTENGQIVDYNPMNPPEPPKPQTSGIQLEGPNGQQMTAPSVEAANELLQSNQGWHYYRPPPSVAVSLGMEKPEKGYMWKVPGDPSQGEIPIPGGSVEKPTDAQNLAAGFHDQMAAAAETIDALESGDPAKGIEPFNPASAAAQYTPDALAKPETQQYRQAQRTWVRAKLRKESGATIGEKEMADEIKTYFPQLNDSPKVIEQKRIARARAERAMLKESGLMNSRAVGSARQDAAPAAPASNGQSIFDLYPGLRK